MSKLADALLYMSICNNHSLVLAFGRKGQDVWVDYYPGYVGPCSFRTSRVHSPSHPTDPNESWIFHGAKAFPGKRSKSLPSALTWASKRYGIESWAPSPFGGKVPSYIRKAAEAAVKERKGQCQNPSE